MDVRPTTFFLILLSAFLFGIIRQRKLNIDVRKYYIISVCFILALQSGLRHLMVGPDTMTYYYDFLALKLVDWNEIFRGFKDAFVFGISKDPGFPLLEKTIQLISLDFHFFLLIIAFFYFSAIGSFIYHNTSKLRDAVFAFTLYIALFQIIGLSGIRQQIAITFALFAYEQIKKNRHFIFFILVLIGSTIHISLLIIIPFWAVSLLQTKFIKFLYIVSLLVLPVIFQFGRSIILFLSSFLVNDYYRGYADSDQGGQPFTYIFFSLSVAFIGFIFINKMIVRNNVYRIFFIAIGMMTFYVPLIIIDSSLIRIGQYFSLYLMVFIPGLISNLNLSSNLKRIILFSLILLLIYLSIRVPFEYYFFWQFV